MHIVLGFIGGFLLSEGIQSKNSSMIAIGTTIILGDLAGIVFSLL